jgi:hypothetical protein
VKLLSALGGSLCASLTRSINSLFLIADARMKGVSWVNFAASLYIAESVI